MNWRAFLAIVMANPACGFLFAGPFAALAMLVLWLLGVLPC